MKMQCILLLTGLVLLSLGMTATGESGPLVCFIDDFEVRTCGQPVYFGVPVKGMWAYPSPNPFASVVDCTTAIDSKSMSITRSTSGGGIHAIPVPYFRFDEGISAVFEVSVYMPSGVGGFVGVNADGSLYYTCTLNVDPVNYGDNQWRSTGANTIATGVNAVFDTWNRVKIEMYDDMTFSAWVTPDGQETIQLADRQTWSGDVPLIHNPRLLPAAQLPNGAKSYYDNLYTAWTDHYGQGYPAIKATENTITIDGNIDLVTEWADAQRVAYKPSGGLGNFRNYWLSNGQDPQGLQDVTEVDIYMTHDADFFYIAAEMTNAAAGLPQDGDESYVEAVFSFVYDDPNFTDISYYFGAHATGSDPLQSPTDSGLAYVGQIVGNGTSSVEPENLAFDPNEWPNNGGEIWYTLNGGVLQAEIKIPFAIMPEFTGPVPGERVHVSFHAQDAGQERSTTNIARELRPFTFYWGTSDAPLTGIAFESCGDELHPYPPGDIDKDCRVTAADLGELALHWLECTKPGTECFE